MRQLMFDNDFTNIMEEPFNFWKNSDDIPEHIKSYISKISSSRSIYASNNNVHYCSTCFKMIDNSFYCSTCKKHYLGKEEDECIIIEKIEEIEHERSYCNYYVFDVINEDVILYNIMEYIYFVRKLIYIPSKCSRLEIKAVYHIKYDRFVELIDNETYMFENLKKYIISPDFVSNDFEYDIFDLLYEPIRFIYTDNLKDLKKTLYKYTYIWELIDYMKNTKPYLSLASLILNPFCYPEFEYLVKLKLYSLALSGGSIRYYGNFKKTFGVSKKYLPFMVKNDINFEELNALRLCCSEDIILIKFVAEHFSSFERLMNATNVDLIKVKQYFDDNPDVMINEYFDYINYAIELGLNVSDPRVLFPDNLMIEHDKLLKQIYTINDPEINEGIKALANILSINKYETDDYVIYPAGSVDDLIDESTQQKNCVRTYCDSYSNNSCHIYFMRKKDDINKSFVTIEVINNKIVQARTRFNEVPDDYIMDILIKWEQQLKLVNNL